MRANPQLYEEERPRTWKDLLGWTLLKRYLAAKRRDPRWSSDALALVGPSGVGKTSVAHLLIEEFASGPRGQLDVFWLDAGKLGGIDQVRGLAEKLRFVPLAKKRVVVVDEAHNLSHGARRGLLGFLERLPSRTLVVFTATGDKWLDLDGGALRARLKVFEVGEIPSSTIASKLGRVARRRGWKLPRRELQQIARASRGNYRQALQDLEVLAATGQLSLAMRKRLKTGKRVSKKKKRPKATKGHKKTKAAKKPAGSRVAIVLFPRTWKAKRCQAWARKQKIKLLGRAVLKKNTRGYAVDLGGGMWKIVGSRKLKSGIVFRFAVPVKTKPKKKTAKAAKSAKKKKRANPSTGSGQARAASRPENLAQAVAKRKEFQGRVESVRIRARQLPKMDSLIELGTVPDIPYRSDKWNGVKKLYHHPFKRRAEPALCMHPSGAYMVLIPPGRERFKVSKRGIE